MMEPDAFNGIDGSTGNYLPAPPSDEQEFVRSVGDATLDPAMLRERSWWIERYGIDDPDRDPVQDVDPLRISSAGWGVVFAPGTPAGVYEALDPLIQHRRSQAAQKHEHYYRSYTYEHGQSKQRFLADHGAGPGPADPENMPYYLLLVGDPVSIPYRFQYELDVQYAVGRIHFNSPDEYARYAQSVVDAETRQGRLPPQRLTFFGVKNQSDRATQRTSEELVEPLAKVLAKDRAWPIETILESQADKARLSRILGGGETPALLFTASHGMGFPVEDSRQLDHQGALLCQDWPGPDAWAGRVPEEHYFAADDVGPQNLLGLIAFHFACYSAGSPELDSFEHPAFSQPRRIAPHPFVSRLAQRLLSHPKGGALAVLGHVDRAWTTSFSWSEEGQIQVFENTLKRLLDGHPIGSATEFVNQRHAELSVEMNHLWSDRELSVSLSHRLFSRTWRAASDARNFVVLGDPAVRLTAFS